MPARQRGSATKRGKTWRARFYDEAGKRIERTGFGTKTEALDWIESQLKTVHALRAGDPAAVARQSMPTLGELVGEYLAQHPGEPNTKRVLGERLKYATHGPGLSGEGEGWTDLPVNRLDPRTIALWRTKLPERSAWGITKALRQVLSYAVRTRLLDSNPAQAVANPEPKREEVGVFTLADLEAVSDELPDRWRPLPLFAGLTGLRPEEWIALEWGDIDRKAGVVHVRRVYTAGSLKTYGKQERSLRTVPLPAKAAEALSERPTGIGRTLVFPGDRGGYLDLGWFRRSIWKPALAAAGIEYRRPYALRHTGISHLIAAGVHSHEIARIAGTSEAMIDKTYGHLFPDSIERTRAALDSYLDRLGADWGRTGEAQS